MPYHPPKRCLPTVVMIAIGSGMLSPKEVASPAYPPRKAGKSRGPMTRRSIRSVIRSRTCSPSSRIGGASRPVRSMCPYLLLLDLHRRNARLLPQLKSPDPRRLRCGSRGDFQRRGGGGIAGGMKRQLFVASHASHIIHYKIVYCNKNSPRAVKWIIYGSHLLNHEL
jgi:hypothetical protein